jgi:hypothetical protein
MKHHFPRRIQPRLEALEERCTPSAISNFLDAQNTSSVFSPVSGATALVSTPSTQAITAAQHQVLFKETLTVVSVSTTGVFTYEGNATHFGHVTAVSYPDNTFVKTAANGDSVFGYLTPASPTTGTITFTGGTGRFVRAMGTASYVISTDTKTGATNIDIVGFISYPSGGQEAGEAAPAAANADTRAVPFKVTGGGTAPLGLPVFPGGTAPHNATGTATHLGNYSGNEGEFELLSFDPVTGTGTFRGSFVFVAANGTG